MTRIAEERFRQPAEWEHHDATWLAWPHLAEEWGDHFDGAQRATAELVRALAAGDERVELLIPPAADPGPIDAQTFSAARLHPARYGDTWLRDTAPVFVTRGGELAATCFRFNGWGQKYDFPGDTEVAGQIARLAGAAERRVELVCEGGAVESDGDGTLLSTRQCLLSPQRNPGRTEDEIAAVLQEAYGAERVLWLDRGLENDHTDGHIDTLVRFVAPGKVVCMEPSGLGDPNREVLTAIRAELGRARDAQGRALEIATVPSPGRVERAGELLAASYVNFLIGNRVVVVPTYGSEHDAEAVVTIAALFPGREVIGLDAYAVMTGGGAFHCISQQQPSTSP